MPTILFVQSPGHQGTVCLFYHEVGGHHVKRTGLCLTMYRAGVLPSKGRVFRYLSGVVM